MLQNFEWYDLVGTIGVLLIVCSYFLLMIRRISSTALSYSTMNAAGAALILISLTQNFNLAAFMVEVFWLIISIVGMALSIHSKMNSQGGDIKI